MNYDKIAEIRARCIAANPVIQKRRYAFEHEGEFYASKHVLPTIHLADVLAALRETDTGGALAIDKDGLFIFIQPRHKWGWDPADKDDPPCWNIYEDDLTRQNDRCIRFLHSRLCV